MNRLATWEVENLFKMPKPLCTTDFNKNPAKSLFHTRSIVLPAHNSLGFTGSILTAHYRAGSWIVTMIRTHAKCHSAPIGRL